MDVIRDKGHVLMLGNRILGIARLMTAGHTEAAAEQMMRLTWHIDPAVLAQYKKAVDAARAAHAAGDAEMLTIIGQGVIDSLVGDL